MQMVVLEGAIKTNRKILLSLPAQNEKRGNTMKAGGELFGTAKKIHTAPASLCL